VCEECLKNPKVKKSKSKKDVSEQAKGSSKKTLQIHGLGEVEVCLTLNDKNIPLEHLHKLQETINLSADKIKKMYVAYQESGKAEEISSVAQLIKILNDCNLFESCMLKWNGNDPTANEKWNLLKDDKDFMEVLCKNLFMAFDVDGNGSISFDELCASIFYLLEGTSDDTLRMRFRSIDIDRSGYIDMKEAKILGGKTMAIIRAGFMVGLHTQKYELMRAGLSESDFIPIVDAIDKAFTQHNYAEKEAKLLFKYVDKDNDDKISEDEYMVWMKDTAAQAARQRELDILMKPVLSSIQSNVQAAIILLLTKIMK